MTNLKIQICNFDLTKPKFIYIALDFVKSLIMFASISNAYIKEVISYSQKNNLKVNKSNLNTKQ